MDEAQTKQERESFIYDMGMDLSQPVFDSRIDSSSTSGIDELEEQAEREKREIGNEEINSSHIKRSSPLKESPLEEGSLLLWKFLPVALEYELLSSFYWISRKANRNDSFPIRRISV